MNEKRHNAFEAPQRIPTDMRSMADASFDQARKAFETFLTGARASASAMEAANPRV